MRLQAQIRKTIVFVTHDIDEAIKMGDRIAILREGSQIAQYDTPETILTAPADDFVADFIGSGASLKRLNLSRVRDIELSSWGTTVVGTDPAAVLQQLQDSDSGSLLVLDRERRKCRWVRPDDVRRADGRALDQIGERVEALVEPDATLNDTLNVMLTASHSVAVVSDERGAYQGIVDIETISDAIRTMRADARQRQRQACLRESEVRLEEVAEPQ